MAKLQKKNNMCYHIFQETDEGYRHVKSFANEHTMRRYMRPDKPVWIIWTRQVTLDNFSSIGMPNGYYWDGCNFIERVMKVRPLSIKHRR